MKEKERKKKKRKERLLEWPLQNKEPWRTLGFLWEPSGSKVAGQGERARRELQGAAMRRPKSRDAGNSVQPGMEETACVLTLGHWSCHPNPFEH